MDFKHTNSWKFRCLCNCLCQTLYARGCTVLFTGWNRPICLEDCLLLFDNGKICVVSNSTFMARVWSGNFKITLAVVKGNKCSWNGNDTGLSDWNVIRCEAWIVWESYGGLRWTSDSNVTLSSEWYKLEMNSDDLIIFEHGCVLVPYTFLGNSLCNLCGGIRETISV